MLVLNDSLNRNFVYDDAYDILNDLAQKRIMDLYPIQHIELDIDSVDSQIQSLSLHPFIVYPNPKHLQFDCFIGIRSLSDHMDENDLVRDMDLTFCVKHILHESRHLYQQYYLYQNPLSGFNLDMARMDMLSSQFRGYHDVTYDYHPAEIDAEIHGLLDTVSYFDQFVDDDGIPIIDARTCLYEKYKELPNNRIWHKQDVTCFDDMIQSLRDQQHDYLTKDRGFPFSEKSHSDQNYLKRLTKYNAWHDVIYSENRVGVQYDEKLMGMAMDLAPLWTQTHEGIMYEAKRISKLYPKQLTPEAELFHDAVNVLSQIWKKDEMQL